MANIQIKPQSCNAYSASYNLDVANLAETGIKTKQAKMIIFVAVTLQIDDWKSALHL